MIRAISILCLVYMFGVAGSIAYRLIHADRKSRYTMLGSYNKGKVTLPYLSVLPLYLTAYLSAGKNILEASLSAFRDMIKSVVLEFNFSILNPLMEQSPIFRTAAIVCFILIIANTAMFVTALFFRQLQQIFKLVRIRYGKKPLLVLVGFHDQMLSVISQTQQTEMSLLILAPITPELMEAAYIYKCSYLAFSPQEDLMKTLKKVRPRYHQRAVRIIIHTQDDSTNLACATDLAEAARDLGISIRSLEENYGLKVFVFGSENSASAYIRLSEISGGCVQYINPYERVAVQFADKYPLTYFLRSDDIHTDTATVDPAVHMRMLLIGFGKTNRQLLRAYVRNNQVQTVLSDGSMQELQVDYFVYDMTKAQEEKNLNHNSFRYKKWKQTADPSECLPLPLDPFQVEFRQKNTANADFYQTLYNDLTSEKPGVNPADRRNRCGIVVSLGSDLENLDIAEKIYEKLTEWDLDETTTVFVHIRDEKVSERVAQRQCADQLVVFGSEKYEVFHPQHILREQLSLMARRRHVSHTVEQSPDADYQKVCATALKKWCTEWNQVQRESNIYACLALRLRLHLLGYDYVPKNAPEKDVREDFLQAYQKNDPIPYTKKEADGHKIVDYSDINFKSGTVRANLARTEHQRWNAYMISCGYVPATRQEIKTLSRQQMFRARKHANLTTFEGLVEYRKMMVSPTCTESDADVIRYDYQLMDDAVWLLEKSGYKIIKRNDGRN